MARPVPQGGGVWEPVLAGLYGFVRTRLRWERQLQDELTRFRNAGLALPDGVVLLDANSHIEWCNPIASEYLGLDELRDLGQPLVNLVRHPDLAAYLEQGEYAEPLTLRLARGGSRVLSLAIIPYGEAQKLLLASDITLAEKVETMRRDFVANVSHELKSPLTVVAGFLETLTDSEIKLDEERRQGYLQMMREHTLRMQRLVEDLLTLSALEGSPGLRDETLVDVCAARRRVRDDAQALSAGRHRVELGIQDAPVLLANAQELRSAFGNLAANAVHYTPAGGDIRSTGACAARKPCSASGQRPRDRAAPCTAPDRALLSRRPQPLARDRGHRSRPGHRQTCAHAPSGGAGNRKRAGAG